MTRIRTLRRGVAALAVTSAVLAGKAVPAVAAGADGTGGGGGHTATRAAMEAAVRADRLPGMIATVREGNRSWSAAVGVADTATGQPRTPPEKVRIGSITKTFTATVLLQLRDEGRLDLDDPVEKWLPGVVTGNGHDGSAITVRRLLDHTSGVFGYDNDPEMMTRLFTPAFLTHRYDSYRPEDLVRIAMSHPPVFPPGARHEYSNTNYILAGMVIRSVTGRPYGEEIERRIIRPLGLTATSLPGNATGLPRPHARGYSTLFGDDPTTLVDTTELNASWGGSAGEMISTTDDLTRFYSALMRGLLLRQTTVTEMIGTDSTNGLGIGTARLACGVTAFGHDGAIHGSTTMALTSRDGRHTLAFNTNADWYYGERQVIEAEFCR